MHISDGELRLMLEARQNGTVDPELDQHVLSCAECQARLDLLAARSQSVSDRLATLETEEKNPVSADAAWQRLRTRLSAEPHGIGFWSGMLNRRFRTAWVLTGLALGLTILFTLPPIQALASRILAVFRVKQFSVVQINPEDLQRFDQLGTSSALSQLISDTVNVEPKGSPQEPATISEASTLSGIQLRVPAEIPDAPRWRVQPGARLTLSIELPRIRAIFEELGSSDISLPESLQGETVEIDIPPIAAAFYGNCGESSDTSETAADPDQRCTVLRQLLNPTVTAPGDLDVEKLGVAMLRLLGLPEEEAAEFSKNVDWTNTLVIPIPRNASYYEQVDVEGVQGMLIRAGSPDPEQPRRYLVVWTRDEIVYAVNGYGTKAEAEAIANSLR